MTGAVTGAVPGRVASGALASGPAASGPAASGPVWRGWLLVVLGVALAAATMAGSAFVGPMIPVATPLLAGMIFYLIVFIPLILCAVVFGWLEGIPPWGSGDRPGRWAAIGIAMGVGGFTVALGYSHLSGTLVSGEGTGAAVGIVIAAVALVLFQSASEEVFFRGWLLQSLMTKIGVPGAVLLSAAVFAAFHILGGARGPLTLVNLVLGGIWFGLLAARSGGIVAPLAAHAAWNVIEDPILGLTPNPGVATFGSMIDLDLVGASLWGGSAEGMNTSISMTIVLAAMIIPLAWTSSVRTPGAPVPRRSGLAA